MRRVAVDTETFLIRPGLLVPRLVCLSAAWAGDTPAWVPSSAIVDDHAALLDAEDAHDALPAILAEDELVFANAPYDLAVAARHRPDVLPTVFRLVEDGRVRDVQVRERLILLSRGELTRARVSLADLVYRYLGEARGKDLAATKGPDAWRMRYAELDGIDLDRWPDAAVAYALDDARLTLEVYDAQAARPLDAGGYPVVLPDGSVVSEDREVRAAWALHLAAAWGLRTDPVAVEDLVRRLEAEAAAGRTAGEAGGWVRTSPPAKAGTLDKKALQAVVSAAYGGDPPKTAPTKTFPNGQVSIATDTLLDAAERPGAPATLRAYADSLRASKVLSVWTEPLRHATRAPSTYRVAHLLETGRTSVSDPPWQQPPRAGGVRECVVPRPGMLLCSVDYDYAELVALAQVHIWMGLGDTLARVINAGRDPHNWMAAEIRTMQGTRTTYEEVVAAIAAKEPWGEHYRQLAKVENFGLSGGLGAARFVDYAAGYGVIFDPDPKVAVQKSHDLRNLWLRAIPEMPGYFAVFARALSVRDTITVQQHVSGRVRGGVGYTDGCNGFFQGLIADVAKDALWRLQRAAYVESSSPFYGSRPLLLLHDEVIAEVPETRAHEAAEEMARLMLAAAADHIPDVTMRAEPALQRRWYKGAKTVRDNTGRLVPWAPKEGE